MFSNILYGKYRAIESKKYMKLIFYDLYILFVQVYNILQKNKRNASYKKSEKKRFLMTFKDYHERTDSNM